MAEPNIQSESENQFTDENINQLLPIDQSKNYIGKWNRLISTTNWEKGNIVVRWRNDLIEQGAKAIQYSDEAWSRMVGDVTAQHVGRLRRTYERFAESYTEYEGLYWSHFYAALDWEDAEMWLEGAVQNRWSVSKMRRQRWETLGKIPEHEPRVADVVVSEIDEGFQPLQFDQQIQKSDRPGMSGPVYEGPDFGDEDLDSTAGDSRNFVETSVASNDSPAAESTEKIFENLTELPEDVAEATESMKLAILRHKLSDWEDISRADIIGVLEALKKLTKSPTDAESNDA